MATLAQKQHHHRRGGGVIIRFMTFDSKARLSGLLGAATLAALSTAALLPTKWVPPTGLGWQVEHFSIYFATAFVLCIAFRRPYVVAISVVTSSAILEALQGLTPDRVPDLTSALCGAAGAISATLLIEFFIRARGQNGLGSVLPRHYEE